MSVTGLSDDRGGSAPGTARQWRAALPAAGRPSLVLCFSGEPAPLPPPRLPPLIRRRCGMEEQRQRLSEERLYQHRGCCGTAAPVEKNDLCWRIVLANSDFNLQDLGALSCSCPLGRLCQMNSQVFSLLYRICCSLALINKLKVSGAPVAAQDSGLHCGGGHSRASQWVGWSQAGKPQLSTFLQFHAFRLLFCHFFPQITWKTS